MSDINTAVPISISGAEYAINGGNYTSYSGTVVEGDRVTVRMTSAAEEGIDRYATLTIGTFSSDYRVSTINKKLVLTLIAVNSYISIYPN